MKKELVQEVINKSSGGNINLETVMTYVCMFDNEGIDKLDDKKTKYLERRLVRLSGQLVGRRISLLGLSQDGYWDSKRGQIVNKALLEYIAKKKIEMDENILVRKS